MSLTSVVAICTADRPRELARALAHITADRPGANVLVVDASRGEETRKLCDEWQGRLSIRHVTTARGLTRQRNEAVAECQSMCAEVVHFIDDDTEIASGYLDAVEKRFLADLEIVGGGGANLATEEFSFKLLRRLFLLEGPPHKMLPSAFGSSYVVGEPEPSPVEWLSGCSMSYRVDLFDRGLFVDLVPGPRSVAEDREFSYRASKVGRLFIEPSALYLHQQTATGRVSGATAMKAAVLFSWRFASRNRRYGLSRLAVTWSCLGIIFLQLIRAGLHRNQQSLGLALGTAQGLAVVLLRERGTSSSKLLSI